MTTGDVMDLELFFHDTLLAAGLPFKWPKHRSWNFLDAVEARLTVRCWSQAPAVCVPDNQPVHDQLDDFQH